MNLRSLVVATVLLTSAAFAQDVPDKIAKDACECMDDVKMDGGDKEEFQTQLGLCFLRSAMPYEKELKKKYDIDMSKMDEKTGEKLGMLIAARMAGTCPEMFKKLAEMDDEEEGSASESEEAPPSSTLDGEITGSRKDAFVTLTVRTASGRTVELLWLEFFMGADQLKNGNAQGLKGQFSYEERELFDASSSTYRKYNVITGFSAQ